MLSASLSLLLSVILLFLLCHSYKWPICHLCTSDNKLKNVLTGSCNVQKEKLTDSRLVTEMKFKWRYSNQTGEIQSLPLRPVYLPIMPFQC